MVSPEHVHLVWVSPVIPEEFPHVILFTFVLLQVVEHLCRTR